MAGMPAPHFFNIHGGMARVIPRMVRFSEFLIGMGYPAISLTNPSDGTYSFSCYESSEKIAGVIAWFYEKEGLRPMMVGHSQGGMQVVKVLYLFAAKPGAKLHVWNPLTWKKENRCEIRDPLTGSMRPVVGLQLPYATSVGPSMRQVVDMAAPQSSFLVITSGESGQPLHAHYDDQTSLWLNGGYLQVTTDWNMIERSKWDRLTLRPE